MHLGLLWENLEGKKPFERSSCRWEEIIQFGLRELIWDGMDWINLVQDENQWRTLVNVPMNL
jgi:hypothetical protein